MPAELASHGKILDPIMGMAISLGGKIGESTMPINLRLQFGGTSMYVHTVSHTVTKFYMATKIGEGKPSPPTQGGTPAPPNV